MNLRIMAINIVFLLIIGGVTAYLISEINKIKPNSETLYGYEIDMVQDSKKIDSAYALQR